MWSVKIYNYFIIFGERGYSTRHWGFCVLLIGQESGFDRIILFCYITRGSTLGFGDSHTNQEDSFATSGKTLRMHLIPSNHFLVQNLTNKQYLLTNWNQIPFLDCSCLSSFSVDIVYYESTPFRRIPVIIVYRVVEI